MPKEWDHHKVKDSKRLSHNRRVEAWESYILPEAVAYCVVSGSAEEVDREGLMGVHKRLVQAVGSFCLRRFPEALIVQDGDVPIPIDGGIKGVVWMPKADLPFVVYDQNQKTGGFVPTIRVENTDE